MFKLEFRTGNAAFSHGDGPYEVKRILLDVAKQVESGRTSGKIMDVNGNCIGEFVADIDVELDPYNDDDEYDFDDEYDDDDKY